LNSGGEEKLQVRGWLILAILAEFNHLQRITKASHAAFWVLMKMDYGR
jgi:hypothetical protein